MSDLKLIKTCSACPEQYDVKRSGVQVGYLRLRHGYFYASCPDVEGEVVYESHPRGDGMFEDDERPIELGKALSAIERWIDRRLSRGDRS